MRLKLERLCDQDLVVNGCVARWRRRQRPYAIDEREVSAEGGRAGSVLEETGGAVRAIGLILRPVAPRQSPEARLRLLSPRAPPRRCRPK